MLKTDVRDEGCWMYNVHRDVGLREEERGTKGQE